MVFFSQFLLQNYNNNWTCAAQKQALKLCGTVLENLVVMQGT